MKNENKSNGGKIFIEEIKERIAALEKERENFVIEANKEIAAYNGAIMELKRLIDPKVNKAKPPETVVENKPAEPEKAPL